MTATDESGQGVGTITFDGSMRFTFADTAAGVSMRYSRVVTGSEVLKFVWEPRTRVDQMMSAPSGLVMDEPPSGVFSLGPVFPNPFN